MRLSECKFNNWAVRLLQSLCKAKRCRYTQCFDYKYCCIKRPRHSGSLRFRFLVFLTIIKLWIISTVSCSQAYFKNAQKIRKFGNNVLTPMLSRIYLLVCFIVPKRIVIDYTRRRSRFFIILTLIFIVLFYYLGFRLSVM